MSAPEFFLDTNVLLYLLSADAKKADQAEAALAAGAVISVQVLNEFAAVATRKLRLSLAEVADMLAGIRALCKVLPLDAATHDKGLELAQRHGFAIYDAMIVAAALLGGCRTLLSEDMQHAQRIERTLRIRNPFL